MYFSIASNSAISLIDFLVEMLGDIFSLCRQNFFLRFFLIAFALSFIVKMLMYVMGLNKGGKND